MRKIWWTVTGLLVLATSVGGCGKCKTQLDSCIAERENLQALFDGSQAAFDDCQGRQNSCEQQVAMLQQQLREKQAIAKQQFDAGFGNERVDIDRQRGTITVTIESGVLFDPGKVTIKSAAKQRLDNIASVIKQKYVDRDISVVGHTDTDPIKKSKWKDNWQLSTERSLAVTRYLINRGVKAARLAAAGRGEYHPLGTKAASRRVEIVVHMY